MKDIQYYLIENELNSINQDMIVAKKIDPDEIKLSLSQISKSQTAVDYIFDILIKKGFTKKSGVIDTATFYKRARITSDVWSTFVSGTHTPSKETLFKIVIAAKLDEPSAREFLSLSGSGFNVADKRDGIILACIKCGYTEPEEVYDILEYYKNIWAGKKYNIKNIY